jgi:hypothetical protein
MAPGWQTLDVRPVDRWTVSVDLGKSVDSTALAVIRNTVTPIEKWECFPTRRRWVQQRETRYDLLHLERFPLGMNYVAQAHRVAEILQREPLATVKPDLVLDQTGVGASVCDIFDAIGLRPHRVQITAGIEVTKPGPRTHHVAKVALISKLESAMHTRELRVAAALSEAAAFRDELRDFQRHVTASGNSTWSAREGKHDDIVLATALGVWFHTARPQPTIVTPLPWQM